MTKQQIAHFLPVAGMLSGLVIAFAFDPTAEKAAWWGMPLGLLVGAIARSTYLRYSNAR